jgi:protein-disulfide isomerase
MKLHLATIAGILLAATPVLAQAPAPKPAAAPSWLTTFTTTADGGMQIGNPRAPVHVLEFSSLTCPHCRDFHMTGAGPFKAKYIATGKVRYEIRNFILNGPDFAATVIARCQGPQRYFALTDLLFRTQQDWIKGFMAISEADSKALQAMKPEAAIRVMADKGGLLTFLQRRGIPRATADRCLADPRGFASLNAIQKQGFEKFDVKGTPTFVLNGKTLASVNTWPALEAELRKVVR